MKNLYMILLALGLGTPLSYAQDTIAIDIGKKAKVLIVAQDKEALKHLSTVDLNEIIEQALALSDTSSTEQTIVYQYKNNQVVNKENNLNDYISTETMMNDKDTTRPNSMRFWVLDLGANTFISPTSLSNQPYRTRSGVIDYVSFGFHQRIRLGREKSPLSIQAGLELSWYNFRFENNNYIINGEEGVEFGDYQQDFDEGLQKSKLVVPYLTLPLRFNLRFRNKEGKRTFNLGFGGHVGYRLNSYSKVKYGDTKHKEFRSYYLNDFRYGLELNLGYGRTLFFIKYDLNPLFDTQHGPRVNALSFGLRL